jgi:hypothetical protein
MKTNRFVNAIQQQNHGLFGFFSVIILCSLILGAGVVIIFVILLNIL